MRRLRQKTSASAHLRAFLAVAIGAIAAFSVGGYPLWAALERRWGERGGASAVFFSLAILLVICNMRLVRAQGWMRTAPAFLLWPALWLLPAWLPRPAEQFHFLLFGVLGIASRLNFPTLPAIGLSILIAVGDEAFQGWLPSRIFDWRDVGANGLAAAIGIAVASRWRPRESSVVRGG